MRVHNSATLGRKWTIQVKRVVIMAEMQSLDDECTEVLAYEDEIDREFKMFLEIGIITKPWKNLQNAGIFFYRRGDFKKSLECLSKAVELVEKVTELGNIYFLEKNVEILPCDPKEDETDEDAKRYYVELFSDLGTLHNTRGVVNIESGDFKNGMEDFDRAIFFAPHLANAHFNKGRGLMHLTKHEEAYRELEIAFLLDQDDDEIKRTLLDCRELIEKKKWRPVKKSIGE